MLASQFVETLFRGSKGWLSLWRSDTKATQWVKTNEPLRIDAYAAASRENSFDAYFGVCLQRTKPASASSRGEEMNVGMMPGVWADFDFASDVKASAQQKPKNYPA